MANELTQVSLWVDNELLEHLQQLDPSLNLVLKRSNNNLFEIVKLKRPSLAELPNHILFKICEFLLPKDLTELRMTGNWKILNIASSDQLWKLFVASEFHSRKGLNYYFLILIYRIFIFGKCTSEVLYILESSLYML